MSKRSKQKKLKKVSKVKVEEAAPLEEEVEELDIYNPPITNLESMLANMVLSCTDKIFVHPNQYPEYYWWRFRMGDEGRYNNTLLLAVGDYRPRELILENLYEAVMEKRADYRNLGEFDKILLNRALEQDINYKHLMRLK